MPTTVRSQNNSVIPQKGHEFKPPTFNTKHNSEFSYSNNNDPTNSNFKRGEKWKRPWNQTISNQEFNEAKQMIQTKNTTNSNIMKFIRKSQINIKELKTLRDFAKNKRKSNFLTELNIYITNKSPNSLYNVIEPSQAKNVLNRNNMKIIETGSNKDIITLLKKAYAYSLNNDGNPRYSLNNAKFNIQKYYNKAVSSEKHVVVKMIENLKEKIKEKLKERSNQLIVMSMV